MQKPKVDHVEGLSPSVAIEQKRAGHSPRSTVGTVTEIYDYLRILMSRLGRPYCPDCNVPIGSQSADEIIAKIMDRPDGTKLYLLAPLELRHGESYETLWKETRASGYVRVRVDGKTYTVDRPPQIDRRGKHDVDVVVDRVTIRPQARSRVAGSVENALSLGRGVLRVAAVDDSVPEGQWPVETHSQHFVCDRCGRSFEPLSPHNFSFNSALGWCPACEGLGTQTGTNPAALLRDPKLTLAQGAVALWPEMDNQPLRRHARIVLERHGSSAGRPLRPARRPTSPDGLPRHRRPLVRRQRKGRPLQRPVAHAQHCVPLPIQGPLSRPGRRKPLVAGHAGETGAPGR